MRSAAGNLPQTAPARRGRLLASLGVALAVAALAFLAGTGWLGGPVYAEVPAATGAIRPEAVVLLLSGDSGFRLGMGGRVASRLSAHGIPVVGVNSLTFFRRARTIAEAAGLIRGGIVRAASLAPGARLVLVGHSFGADMLQVGLAGMAPAERRNVALVALVVPSRVVTMQAAPAGLFAPASPPLDAMPTARSLGWAPTLCVSGEAERDSLCPALRQPNVSRLMLPGGHRLRYDADRVSAALLAAIARTAHRPAA